MARKPRANPLGAIIVGRDKSGGVKTYQLPDGRVISKRQYQAEVRQITLLGGLRVSNERFQRIAAVANEQIRASKADLTMSEKKALAFRAATLGLKSPGSKTNQAAMFRIMREELEIDHGSEVPFVWGENTSDDAA